MTTLADIRNLEVRLHSHALEWSDIHLQNELLFLLDDLQELHHILDLREAPATGPDGLELSLKQRILLFTFHPPNGEPPAGLYGKPQASDPQQQRLF